MMSRIWQILAGALGVAAAALYAVLKGTQSQRDKARDKAKRQARRADAAEKTISQRREADQASADAKKEGQNHVAEAREKARDGRRDQFAGGWVRDED